jgi:nitrogen fixation NifU-like protein
MSKASPSAMTEVLKGSTAVDAHALFADYRSMILENQAGPAGLGTLTPFAAVRKFPARIKCALLPWHAAIAAIAGHKQTVSTEDRL